MIHSNKSTFGKVHYAKTLQKIRMQNIIVMVADVKEAGGICDESILHTTVRTFHNIASHVKRLWPSKRSQQQKLYGRRKDMSHSHNGLKEQTRRN